MLTMSCGEMPDRYVYDKPKHILIPYKSDWSTVRTHSGRKCCVWYTDGSKMDRKVLVFAVLMNIWGILGF